MKGSCSSAGSDSASITAKHSEAGSSRKVSYNEPAPADDDQHLCPSLSEPSEENGNQTEPISWNEISSSISSSHCCPVNNIITIQQTMQATMTRQIDKVGMFSVHIDRTLQHKTSVLLCHWTSMRGLLQWWNVRHPQGSTLYRCWLMERMKLDLSSCICTSTDGATHMQGKYKGFNALLSTKSPN